MKNKKGFIKLKLWISLVCLTMILGVKVNGHVILGTE